MIKTIEYNNTKDSFIYSFVHSINNISRMCDVVGTVLYAGEIMVRS